MRDLGQLSWEMPSTHILAIYTKAAYKNLLIMCGHICHRYQNVLVIHMGTNMGIYTTDAGEAHMKYRREYNDILSMRVHACHGCPISLVIHISIGMTIYVMNARASSYRI